MSLHRIEQAQWVFLVSNDLLLVTSSARPHALIEFLGFRDKACVFCNIGT